MSLEELITTYGYSAIAIGAFLEGETILILGGFAAHRGYLELPWVLVSAFLGTLLGDQLYFYIGRVKGKSILEKRPHLKCKSEKVFAILNKHQTLLILGFRFMYGFRTITPFLLGACEIRPFRFLILNFIGALIWSMTIGIMGYLLGHTLELIIDDIKRYEAWLFIGLSILSAIAWCIYFLSKKKSSTNK
ncbi:DedA family protein [Nitrosomonas sp. Nm132]|uniref:DedA family protein n=1 Tax=Nitrosomonas sp. Nm132 TaxID=1881053 RepID=UPI000883B4DF|nr:DedA family protein [Nitrosomonas sp. Nm132]SDG82632.1 membrane protein DedA, SNARE-associated domain [Nitrosomonas sp. Nm132]